MLLGSLDCVSDAAAYLVDLTSPGAAQAAWPLCEDLVFLQPRLLTIRTAAQQEVWAQLLEQVFERDPDAAILRVRWRPSRHGGRIWATPPVTAQQLGAASRLAARAAVPSAAADGRTTLSLRGPLGHDPARVMTEFLAVLQTRTGLSLMQATDAADERLGTWRLLDGVGDPGGAGRVRLALSSLDEARRVAAEFHGRAINVGPDLIAIEVSNDLLGAPGAGNGRRTLGGRAPTSA